MTTERLELVITDTGGTVVQRRLDDIGKTAVKTQGSIDLLSRAFAGLASVLGTAQIVKLLDTYTNMQNRLKLVTTGTQNLAAVTEELFNIANRTRTSFEATTTLYARVALATKELGIGQQQLMKFVEGVNQAVVLSGVSAQEARNAIIQFTQGLAKGRLDGDELRSVLEQIPFVADVIAKKLGVARGELRELGKQGKLTPTVIVEAFQAMEGSLTKLFSETLPTFSQAWQVFSNRMMQLLGGIANNADINKLLAQSLALVADNFDVVTAAVAGLIPLLGVLLGRAALGGLITTLTAIGAFAVANPFTAIFIAVTSGITAFGQLNSEMDEVLKTMGRSVNAVDKLVATWSAARVYVEAIWDNFPEWFEGIMARAVDLAVAQWAKLADRLKGAIESVGPAIDSKLGDGTGKLFTNMFKDVADQFKSSGELNQQIDFAADYIQRYPDAVRKAGDAAKEAYNNILLERSKVLGELTSGKLNGKAAPVDAKAAARLIPKNTFNDEIKDLQRQIELLSVETSERERLVEVLKIEDKIRNSITDRDARRKFNLSEGEVQQINDMVGALQRLKAESDVFDEIRKPALDLQGQMSALNSLFGRGIITVEEYTKKFLELQIQLAETNTTLEGGIMRGILKIEQEFNNLSTLAENTLVNSIKSAEDAFVQFVKTGKFNFSDLVDSIITDLIRLSVRQSISGPLVQALGGILGAYFSPAGGVSAGSSYVGQGMNASNGSGLSYAGSGAAFATGGDMTVGGTGGVDSQMVNFRATPGEKIYIRKPGEREPGESGGGVTVLLNVVNNAGASVQTRQSQDSDGNPQIDVLIDQMQDRMAADIRKGQGPILPAISEKLGVSAKPGNR